MRLQLMTVQWGSCSPSGRITLNPLLVKAPRECIDYVLLHELCHLLHHNHSPKFYRTLDRHMPNWRAVKEKLDNMAERCFAPKKRQIKTNDRENAQPLETQPGFTVSLYLLRASKVSEALQQLEAAGASVTPLIDSIPEGSSWPCLLTLHLPNGLIRFRP